MADVRPVTFEPDLATIIRYAEVTAKIVGREWIGKGLRKIQTEKPPKKLRTHSYLYRQPKHPLLTWFAALEKWRQECLSTGKLALSEDVVKMTVLGRSLDLVRSQLGFDRLIPRLRDAREFHAAAFEAEVGASYVSRGWTVEFLEEGAHRTPDIKVTRADGSYFWVECKQRDKLTKRDKLIESVWTAIESNLLRDLGPRRQNYLIALIALTDPERKDADYLRQVIKDAIASCANAPAGPQTGEIRFQQDRTGRFEIAVRKLTGPDEITEADQIGFQATEAFDRVVVVVEAMRDSNGKTHWRNPIVIAFKTRTLPDRVSGVRSALKEAVPQLPQGGPGIVWIRIPDNSWGDGVSRAFERAQEILKGELHGDQNTRVNAVFVMTRVFQRLEKEGAKGLSYRTLIMRIEHDNPAAHPPKTNPEAPPGQGRCEGGQNISSTERARR